MVKAISVNPVDTKVRAPKEKVETTPRVLGWDAAGEAVAIGDDVEHHTLGDQVYYAGDIRRPRSNSKIQMLDKGIVDHKPDTLIYTGAAARPLTCIAA
ncbi:MAG: hypothetical protein Hals2KO_14650 [Halioglobus sp.]